MENKPESTFDYIEYDYNEDDYTSEVELQCCGETVGLGRMQYLFDEAWVKFGEEVPPDMAREMSLDMLEVFKLSRVCSREGYEVYAERAIGGALISH